MKRSKTLNKRSKKAKCEDLCYNVMKDSINNLYTANEMLNFACENISNRDNLYLMEWSEAVIYVFLNKLTFKNLKAKIFETLTWSKVLQDVEERQWSIQLYSRWSQYYLNKSLIECFKMNRNIKTRKNLIVGDKMFYTKPEVCIKTLTEYTPEYKDDLGVVLKKEYFGPLITRRKSP